MLELNSAIGRAGAIAANLVIGRFLNRNQQQKLVDSVRPMLSEKDAFRNLESLDPGVHRGLNALISAAHFDYLALQLTVWQLVHKDDDDELSRIREALRLSIQQHTDADQENLLLVTDAVLELLMRSVQAACLDVKFVDGKFAASVAADAAAAMARSSGLLREIRLTAELDAFAQLMRSQARAIHNQIRLIHIGYGTSVDHDRLYVAPNLRIGRTTTAVKIDELLTSYPRLVVLGDPGSGKSTLISRLASDLTSLPNNLPVVLLLRDHAEALIQQQMTLVDCLEAICRASYHVSPPARGIEALLLRGRVTVFVDGLDELGHAADRRRFTELLEAFAHRYPLARIVVTARSIGYSEAPLDPRMFPTVGIDHFSPALVVEYATRWFGLDEHLDVKGRDQIVEGFLAASAAVDDLRRNPLLLALLCALYSARKYVPRNRPEVYEKCAEMLFEQWDGIRGLPVQMRFEPHLRPALSHLAWTLVTSTDGGGKISHTNLLDVLTQQSVSKFASIDDARSAAMDFLNICAGRAWVLTIVDSEGMEPIYGFAHRTFLEYFAALQMVRLDCAPVPVWEKISQYIDVGGWHVMNQLAVQILDRSSHDGANRLMRHMLSLEVPPDRKALQVGFAIGCFDFVIADQDVINDIADSAVSAALQLAIEDRLWSSGLYDRHPTDAALLRLLAITLPDNAERVAVALAAILHQYASKPSDEDSAALVVLLIRRLGRSPSGSSYPVASKIVAKLEAMPIPESIGRWRRALTNPGREEIEKHGVRILFANPQFGPSRSGTYIQRLVDATAARCGNPFVATARLARLYPVILDQSWPWDRGLNDGIDPGYVFTDSPMERNIVITWSILHAIKGDAAATLLLLMIPALERMADPASFGNIDRTLHFLLNGRGDLASRPEAAKQLAALGLPQAAHARIWCWLFAKVSAFDDSAGRNYREASSDIVQRWKELIDSNISSAGGMYLAGD